MSSLRSGRGRVPAPMSYRPALSRAILLAAAATLAGCAQHASQQTAGYDPRVTAQQPYHVMPDSGRKPDLEADGREAQLPPVKRQRAEPDDPREPWSPNYGEAPPVKRADAAMPARTTDGQTAGWSPIVRGQVPNDLPASFRRRLASAMDD